MKTVVILCAVFLAAFGLVQVVPTAQAGLTTTLPASGARLAAGPDYATDILGDPWDMSNPEDISQYVTESAGWGTDFGFTGGTVGGTIVGGDAYLSLLYRGHSGIINTGRTGLRFPIDTSVYKKLAFRMSSGMANQNPQITWFFRPAGPGDLGGVGFANAVTAIGYKIYEMDLTSQLTGQAGQPWSSAAEHLVRGLRIDPNSGATGHQVFFDWVRLTRGDSDSAAVSQTISWSGGSTGTSIRVEDAAGTQFTIATGLGASGSMAWKYGGLPPGSYSLLITSGGSTTTTPFSINTPPLVRITDPDETGGEDYATAVLHNPWDMNASTDVQFMAHVLNPVFNGVFHGMSDNVDAGAGTGDAQVYLLADPMNPTPIVSSRYRFLTYRLDVDLPWLQPNARLFWGATNQASQLTQSTDIIVFPGMQSYTIDLGALSTAVDGGIVPGGPAQPWMAANIKQFRIDPHELRNTGFHLDDVKLAAMDEAVGGSFVIRFAGSDPDSGAVPTVTLFYDTNNNPVDGRTQIAAGLPLSGGIGQYSWNTSGIPAGVYYISADITDGLDTRTTYSTGQLQVGSAAPPPAATGDEAAMDFGAAGLWAMYNNGPFSQLHPGNPGVMATGDLDGNGQVDLIVDFPGAGVWVWSNNSSWYQLHTADAASIVTGDLDGNGKSEVLLDFPGQGTWVRLNNSSWFRLHPASPSRMVMADLDGNRQDEVILDFPGAGVWVWKNNTSWSQLHTANAAAMVAGDFDASGRKDLILGFPGAGLWVWSNNTSWFRLHPSDASVMTTAYLDNNNLADAIISFPGAGIWAWMNSGGFVQLHNLNGALMTAADLDGNGRDDVIISFPGGGVWALMNNASWRQLHSGNPEGIAVGNLDGN